MALKLRSRTSSRGPAGSLRRFLVTSAVLLVIAIGGGFAYNWYMGQYGPKPSIVEPPAPKSNAPVKPTAIPDDVRVGVAVQVLTSPIKQGSNASIQIKTNPHSACSIRVEYGLKKEASTDSGLVPKSADEYGSVRWSWKVEDSRPVGTWPVTVTCANKKYSGVGGGNIVVEKKGS
ncbi:MAG: hypothetical protein WBB94_00265 [Candidatus Saccharimonadaceae bacterium]